MKAYKIVLKYSESYNEFHFCEIRYFMKKDLADKVNLELQEFLNEITYKPYLHQYLAQYAKLILLLEKEKKLTESKMILLEKLEDKLSDYIEFMSKWPKNTKTDLLHYFSFSHKDSEVVEFEIEETT